VERLWKLLHTPLFLNANTCLRVRPQALFQRPVTEQAQGYQLSAGLVGEVVLTGDCASDDNPATLPDLVQQPAGSETSLLRISAMVKKDAVERELRRQLSEQDLNGAKVTDLKVFLSRAPQGATAAAAGVLDIGVELGGTACGTLWLRTRPTLSSEGQLTLELVNLPVTQGSVSTELAERISTLAAKVRPHLVVQAPAALLDLQSRFEEWFGLAEMMLEEAQSGGNEDTAMKGLPPLQLRHSFRRATQAEALVTSEGIQIVMPLEAELTLHLR
jgi:hypothetical protein